MFVNEGLSESSTVYDSAFMFSFHSNSISGNKTPALSFTGDDKLIGLSVNSGCTTLSSTFLFCVSSPLVAIIFISYVPAATSSKAPTVSIISPLSLIDDCEKEAVAPVGKLSTETVVVV